MAVRIHFLNVGSGDCTIIHFPPRTRKDGKMKAERVMMVDINHHDDHDEYENVLDYYKHNIRNKNGELLPIFRFICTHPHQDHICGLRRLFDDQDITICNFWDLTHSFTPDAFGHHPTHKDDWSAYEQLRGADSPATVIRTYRERETREFWNDEEDRITILSPTRALRQFAHFKEDGTERKPEDVEIDEMS